MMPTPDAIFLRAQQVWAQRALPAYESFRIACSQTFLSDQCLPGETVEFTVRWSDGHTFAQTVATPSSPSRVLMHGDYITGPDGTPLGFYRMIPSQPGGAPPRMPPNMAEDPLVPTIAVASAVARAYVITLAGNEQLGAYDCYHLTLKPLENPQRYALRELWVDQQSGNVVRLVYAHDFGNGRWGTVDYRFAPSGPAEIWTIVYIDASAPTGSLFGPREDHVASALSDIAFPAAMPDADFEP